MEAALRPPETTVTGAAPASRRRSRRLSELGARLDWRPSEWWQWTPLPLAAAYLLSVLVHFQALIGNTYLSADFASAPVIGELYGGSPAHRQVVLGSMAWFSTLIFELTTRWLPLHRQIWEGAPYAMALTSVALIAWGAWRVTGRRGAIVAGAVALCAGPRMLYWLFALDDHAPSWFCLTLLAALVVALEQRPAWLARPRALAPAVAVIAVIVGVNAASDPVVLVGALAPLLLACAAVWALRPALASARALAWAAGCAVLAIAADVLTRALMRHENVVAAPNLAHNKLASPETVVSNLTLWWQSLTRLGSGDFYGATLGFSSALRVMCAILSLAAVAAILPTAWRELSRLFGARGERSEDEPARAENGEQPLSEALAPRPARITPPPVPRSRNRSLSASPEARAALGAWCLFWAASAAALSVSFVFSTNPESIWSSRYLVGVVYAVAGLMAVLMTRRRPVQLTVIAGTAVFAFTGIVSLWNGLATENTSGFATDSVYQMVANVARREHLTVGYGGYWDAAPLTWATHMRVKVFPLAPCPGNQSLCLFNLHYITSWYTPRPHARSFLIYDPTQGAATPAVPSLGKPSAEYHFGQVTMYVYPYDIASRVQ